MTDQQAVAAPQRWLLVSTMAGLAGGAVAAITGAAPLAAGLWTATAVIAMVPTAIGIVKAALRHQPGVDVIALLALVGAVVVGEFAAAAVIAVMVATGQWLEARAKRRAQKDLEALLARVPSTTHVQRSVGEVVEVPIADVEVGDVVVVRAGQTVPVDARVRGGAGMFDLSALTGEPEPITLNESELVPSGAVNAGGMVELRAVATAEASTYAGIVRLVSEARAESAPFVRLADRFALWFVPLTVGIAAAAWVVSGSPDRAVAVLVVATPCPLILAVPVAISSGLARASRRGVIVKGGAVLERLGRAQVLVFDKTGTVTAGRPQVIDVVAAPGGDTRTVLELAGSLEQASPHVLASAIVDAASGVHADLAWPTDTAEVLGSGSSGSVRGAQVRVGRLEWLGHAAQDPWLRSLRRRIASEGVMTVFVEVDRQLAGAIVLEDPVRPDATRTLRALRRAGIGRLVMATGDRALVADAVGAVVGADEVLAERTPEEKAAAVQLEKAGGVTVMVGDGVNDAPALAAADVGVALGARGSTASSETADVVLSVDRIDRLVDAVHIARRSHRVALESVVGGMGLAAVAMAFAAAGLLPALAGAIVQEAIDVLAIANALRALLPGHERLPRLTGEAGTLSNRFRSEHPQLMAGVRQLRPLADDVDQLPPAEARRRLVQMRGFLQDELLPHELAEDTQLYPAVARLLGGDDATAPMSRMHVEIAHLVGLFGRLVDELSADGPDSEDVRELRRVLYGLDAILRLHFAQEEQEYLSLAEEASATPAGAGRNEHDNPTASRPDAETRTTATTP